MKKLVLIITVFAFALNANAQDGFRTGVNVGIPVGDFTSVYSLAATLDVDYDWKVSESFIAGISTGFTNYFGKDGIGGFKYIPVAASVDLDVSDDVSVGGDAGYAISLESGGSGDFLYRIQIRYQASDEIDLTGRWNSISGNGVSISNVSFGVGFRF
jgi:Outer membrane protein beta-barrel domain